MPCYGVHAWSPYITTFLCVCMCYFLESYYVAKFLNDRSLVQIPFSAPPSDMTANISLYIDFLHIFGYIRWFGRSNSTVVARLTLVSSYSGISLPVNNTILPVVTLTAPNGTEGASVIDIPLNNTFPYIKYCYNALQKRNHSFISVPVNIRSPLMYTQLGQYDFVVDLELFSPDSTSLSYYIRYQRDSYTLTVNITNNGNLHLQTLHVLHHDNHSCTLYRHQSAKSKQATSQ